MQFSYSNFFACKSQRFFFIHLLQACVFRYFYFCLIQPCVLEYQEGSNALLKSLLFRSYQLTNKKKKWEPNGLFCLKIILFNLIYQLTWIWTICWLSYLIYIIYYAILLDSFIIYSPSLSHRPHRICSGNRIVCTVQVIATNFFALKLLINKRKCFQKSCKQVYAPLIYYMIIERKKKLNQCT